MENFVKVMDISSLRPCEPLSTPNELREYIGSSEYFKTRYAGDSVWFDYARFDIQDWLNTFAIVENSKQAHALMRRTVEEAKKVDPISSEYTNLFMQIKGIFIENGIWEPVSKKETYRRMSDEDLENAVIAYGLTPSELIKENSTLYSEVNSLRRINVRKRLTSSLGWRRTKMDWENFSIEEWCEIASQYPSLSLFKDHYSIAYSKACTLGKISTIKQELAIADVWGSKVGLDGKHYDSESEMAVANWLYLSGIYYKSHPAIGLCLTKKKCKADFVLPSQGFIVEVWAFHPEISRKEHLPPWAENYFDKRKRKEEYYQSHGLVLISIEAESYRTGGTDYYLDHVKSQFSRAGVELSCCKSEEVMRQSQARGYTMSVEDAVKLCKELGYKYSTHLLREGTFDIYNGLKDRGLIYDLTLALAKLHGRVSACPRDPAKRPDVEDLRTACMELGIKYRKEYEGAYRNGLLPKGAPMSVRQTYGLNWQEFITGRGRSEFLPFDAARKLVRSLNLTSRGEFNKAVASKVHPNLEWVRKNPGNKVAGGYPEWQGWRDFLGK